MREQPILHIACGRKKALTVNPVVVCHFVCRQPPVVEANRIHLAIPSVGTIRRVIPAADGNAFAGIPCVILGRCRHALAVHIQFRRRAHIVVLGRCKAYFRCVENEPVHRCTTYTRKVHIVRSAARIVEHHELIYGTTAEKGSSINTASFVNHFDGLVFRRGSRALGGNAVGDKRVAVHAPTSICGQCQIQATYQIFPDRR